MTFAQHLIRNKVGISYSQQAIHLHQYLLVLTWQHDMCTHLVRHLDLLQIWHIRLQKRLVFEQELTSNV